MRKQTLIGVRFLLVSICFLMTLSGWAAPESDAEILQRNRPRMFAIMSSVARSDGHVDKILHDEFWALLPASIRRNPKSLTENLDILRGMVFQKELWESIRLSARARQVVKTISYDSAKAKALSDNASGKDASVRADQMIEAAATGKPFNGSHGTGLLTEDMANQALDGLNASYTRLERLLNPVWREPKKQKSNISQ